MEQGSDAALIKRAIKAYLRSGSPDQPGKDSLIREADGQRYVLVRNKAGLMAVYLVVGTTSVQRVREWPESLDIS
ncbi:hypothetical protein GCM10007242_02930 [Pigmentiphaga litoralis]|jgi:hypothetical protein|uniref:hypothetical protein n=1 Tax=Pigmentiphaga litoralis TaxID=516702 RepID=UPI00167BC3C4|nr:hypothetical protein [Pigmentiphaga litoralis]GGX01451.1 hypothetical protein GCM10007242_02930 [Pigmentiphaga litoralis]